MEEQKKKDPFDEWLDYALQTVLSIKLKFPKEMSAVQSVIIEKALKPYHFWLEEKGIKDPKKDPQKITPNQRAFIERILSRKDSESKEIARAINLTGKGLDDLTKDEASRILEAIAK
ncbi:MAG: hypothetical protein KIS29_09905 [Thermoplasmata archaeon]|nr:hypothetical protein [Candidatus Sysuiplasma jiujiangense]